MPGTILTNLHGSGWPASGPSEIGSGISRRLQIEMGSELYSISPASTPFLLILNQLNKQESAQGRFDYQEDYAFNIRTFEADIVCTKAANNMLAYLRLRTPSDAQALESPPYLADADAYDLSDLVLVKISYASVTNTYDKVAWFILEKNGVEWASQWRTVDTSQAPFSLDTADPAGYLVMLAFNDNAGATDINFGDGGAVAGVKQTKGWHLETGVNNGGIQQNEAVIVRDAGGVNGPQGTDWGDIPDTDAPTKVTGAPNTSFDLDEGGGPGTDGIFPCYVEIFTPDMMEQGYFEGSGLPQESHRGTGHGFNYLQIFKTPYSMTGSARATKYVGTDEWTRKRIRKAAQHAEDMEQAFLFQGAETISNIYDESPRRTTRGLGIGTAGLGSIKTYNVDRLGGSTHTTANPLWIRDTSTNFFDDMMDVSEMIFEDHVMSSGTKLLMGGPKLASAFANAGMETGNGFQYMPGEGEGKKFGLTVTTYITPHGTIKFMKHPKFRGRWANYGVFLDMAHLAYRYLPGRDNLLMTGTQLNDEDKYGEAILTEAGLECRFEQTHAIVRLYTP